jgi:hypothetical protein
VEKNPRWRAIGISKIKIKWVCFDVYWNHILCIEFYNVKGRIFSGSSCQASSEKINANIFCVWNALCNLDVFLMSMAVKTDSDNILKPIHQSSKPMPPSVSAISYSGQMSYKNCLATSCFNHL